MEVQRCASLFWRIFAFKAKKSSKRAYEMTPLGVISYPSSGVILLCPFRGKENHDAAGMSAFG